MSSIIQVNNLSKSFTISHEGSERYMTLRDAMTRRAKKLFSFPKSLGVKNNPAKEEFWALKDVTFNVLQGDRVGIIGRNGAGKSTLLKILSRITEPTTGSIKIKGRVASLLEVGTGFHPELTGRENIFLNGAILGMSRAEIKKHFDAIVDFAEIEKFLDTPVKRYSSGMYVRLAFAVAAHLEPEILVVDEVLAVGDAQFQKKCLGKMEDVSRNEGRTVLFVSHNMGAIQQLCSSSILMKKGRLLEKGDTGHILKLYMNEGNVNNTLYEGPSTSQKKIWFKKIYVSDINGNIKEDFFHDEKIYVNFELGFNVDKQKHDYNLFLMVKDQNKVRIFAAESDVANTDKLRVVIDSEFLVRGSYSLHTFVHKAKVEQLDAVEDICNFNVIDNGSPFNIHGEYDYGKVFPRAQWEVIS